MKRLLVFFDGTWNTADGRDAITNVVKLHRAVLPEDASGVRQVARYVVGIATEDSYGRWKFAVGAAGVGVAERIQEGYEFLVENYEPGDEIFLFGFSRGAFQARSLGGIITLCGIMRADHKARAGEAWLAYQAAKSKSGQQKIRDVRALAHHPVRIRCIGVWDTVGNLGIPLAPRMFDSRELSFHSTELSPLVDVGLHALSIDEPRGPFSPTLWTRRRNADLPVGQVIEQVWFPGCHANVGGGYPDSGLSDISLLWMAERVAANTGLALDLEGLRRTSVADPLAEEISPTSDALFRGSWVLPFVRLIRQSRRGIPPLRRAVLGTWRTSALPPGDVPVNESIHASAIERYGKRVRMRRGNTVGTITYKPRNLKAALGIRLWRRKPRVDA